MRHRLPRLALSLTVLLAALAAPGQVVACSCAMDPDPFAELPADVAVVIGRTVREHGAGSATVAVDAWFRGPAPAPTIEMIAGDAMCGAGAPPAGPAYLLTVSRMPDGRYQHGLCGVHTEVDSPDGQRLLAQATRVLGPPVPVGGTQPAAGSEPVPVIEIVALAIIATGIGLGLLAGALAVLRRRTGT